MNPPILQLESDTFVITLSNQCILTCADQARTGYTFARLLYSQFASALKMPSFSEIICHGKTLVLERMGCSIRRRL